MMPDRTREDYVKLYADFFLIDELIDRTAKTIRVEPKSSPKSSEKRSLREVFGEINSWRDIVPWPESSQEDREKRENAYREKALEYHYYSDRELEKLLPSLKTCEAKTLIQLVITDGNRTTQYIVDNFDGIRITNSEEWHVYYRSGLSKITGVGSYTLEDMKNLLKKAAFGQEITDKQKQDLDNYLDRLSKSNECNPRAMIQSNFSDETTLAENRDTKCSAGIKFPVS